MSRTDSVIIQGVPTMDDGLQIDLSGPDGPTRFRCPDCAHEIVFDRPGRLVCVCHSVFCVERYSPMRGRVHPLVRRAAS